MSNNKFFGRTFRAIDSIGGKKIYVVMFLTITNSISESLTLFLLFPFIASLNGANEIKSSGFIFNNFVIGINELVVGIVLIVIISGLLKILYIKYMSYVAYGIGENLSKKLYESYLLSPYEETYYLDQNSTVTIFLVKINLFVTSIILPIFTVINSIIMATFILVSTAFINPFISLTTILSLSIFYLIISALVKKKLAQFGLDISEQTTNTMREIYNTLKSPREIILSGTSKIFLDRFNQINSRLRVSLQSSYLIGASPRIILETLGISFLIIISSFYYSVSNEMVLPSLAIMAISTAKLLPLMQQIFKSWTLFKGAEASSYEILDLLEQQKSYVVHNANVEKLSFETEIRLSEVSFKYRNLEKYTFQNINLSIPKGSKVGIIGPSGSGKSTLLDIVSCMKNPTIGEVWLDGTKITDKNRSSFHSLIGFVPQSIHLIERSIVENIAFGLPLNEINYAKIDRILNDLNMENFIKSLPDGLLTKFDSGVIRVSGGQRQKIGIARALYREPEIIFLDEATNSLDLESHKAILDFVSRTDKTVIIVSHDDIKQYCDRVFVMSDIGIEVALV